MGVYGRELLVSARYKSVINTAAVTHTKSCIYTAAMQNVFIHCCRAFSMKCIHVFTWQSFLKKKKKKKRSRSMFARDKLIHVSLCKILQRAMYSVFMIICIRFSRTNLKVLN